MTGNDPQRLRVAAAQKLVERLTEKDLAAVLEFSRDGSPPSAGFLAARLLQTFTANHDLLNAAIALIGQSGTTPLYDALLDSIGLLKSEAQPNPAEVVLTDGLENASSTGTVANVIDEAVAADIPIFPIGLGTGIDFTELQELARRTGGTFASALNPQELEALFQALGTAVTQGRFVVTATVQFDQAVGPAGVYTIAGTLETTLGQQTRAAPFSFQVVLGNAKALRLQTAEPELP
jgi:hypothetical protein